MPVSRSDLHVHSKYSDRPSEWILRRIGAPECYTPPAAVYQTARRRGMQFMTISDHNCIQGALEIAHLPGAFVSNEVTAYFPDDGCKVHVLCWNITEAQFRDIQSLRQNIVLLRDYFQAQGIVHSGAHPLYVINDRLTIDHFEKLLLLFNVFETMNGGRNRRGNDLMLAILKRLDRAQFEDIANRHDIAPVGDTPWIKGFTGGSDDHSGTFIAKGFTECPASQTVEEFLSHVGGRRSVAGGLDGTPLSFAHSLYGIGYQYYRDRFLSKSGSGSDLIVRVMGEVFGRAERPAALRDRVSGFARRIAGRPQKTEEIAFKRMVSIEMVRLFGEDWLKDDFVASPMRYEELNRRTFELASHVTNQLLFRFSTRFIEKLSSGSLFGSLEALSAAGPLLLGVGPYLFSFVHQNRDKAFLAEVRAHFLGGTSAAEARPKKAWFVDPPSGDGHVTMPYQEMCRLASVAEQDLTLIAVADDPPDHAGRMKHFKPVGRFDVPDLDGVTLTFPPFLDILEYCDREQFTELIISTPGPVGLAALASGKMLKTKLVGICDTCLPQSVVTYTDDESLESASWRYLCWFYDQMDVVVVPSAASRQQLIAKGVDAKKLSVAPPDAVLEPAMAPTA